MRSLQALPEDAALEAQEPPPASAAAVMAKTAELDAQAREFESSPRRVFCPSQKLRSRMDAPIFVFYRDWKFHTFGAYFNR